MSPITPPSHPFAKPLDPDGDLKPNLSIGFEELTTEPRLPFGNVKGYESLFGVLREAYEQSALYKGKERHANAKPFDQQPILQILRMVGPGFGAGQSIKKVHEAIGMVARGQGQAAEQELLGAIVYAAATILAIRELRAQIK